MTMKLETGGETIQWKTSVYFYEFPDHDDETAILGHIGFLEFFTATFDGKREP